MLKLLKSVVGDANERALKKAGTLVEAVRKQEALQDSWTDDQFSQHTRVLKDQLAQGRALDELIPEAFAMVIQASRRRLGMRHFDVQILGGLVLHRGKIAEMRTGEGKTLVATMPSYLNALSGKGVHIITVNDYLARRDSTWMSEIYHFLGMEVGCIVPGLDDAARKQAYQADITYATNSELGFDFLRDNLRFSLESMVQRPFHYALVDEVDNILIDEARTPLIISGSVESSADTYKMANSLVAQIKPVDFEIDEKQRQLSITSEGTSHIEELLQKRGYITAGSLFDLQNIHLIHYVQQALKAHHLFKRETEYIVTNREVVLIDEFTGRMMEGRRLSEGLHQAIEAKENVPINSENQTIASVTYQNLFRLFPKLSGMTGTALTEAAEFEDIYRLGVVSIPTHRKMIRIDHDDEIYRSSSVRDNAVLARIQACQEKGQPVLIGTVSIEKSEKLARLLSSMNIRHNVLNARYHDKEAEIIANAGCLGAVTIATNMAGRGTDIQLGGNQEMRLIKEIGSIDKQLQSEDKSKQIRAQMEQEKEKVIAAGGLCIIGTERHDSRRIDNQLRGRSGRQGDPGESRFYISLEDDLMRVFGVERMESTLKRLGLKEDEALVHPWLTKAIERAQSRVEQMHFDVRKQVLRFDDVLNEQRKMIFGLRKDIMGDDRLKSTVDDLQEDVSNLLVSASIEPEATPGKWRLEELEKECYTQYGLRLPLREWVKEEDGIDEQEIQHRIHKSITERIEEKESKYGYERMRVVEKHIFLTVIDQSWRILLQQMEQLRRGIGLRAYGQKDPLIEYKREAITLFQETLDMIKKQAISLLCRFELTIDPPLQPSPVGAAKTPVKRVPRNAPCPCGSGRKYKHCHGKF